MNSTSFVCSPRAALFLLAALPLAACASANSSDAQEPQVQVTPKVADHRVDITVDGKAFTSFLFPENLPKQVLYPISTASGKVITRGWPLVPRAGERVDHPHHIGLWFNHSDVNGFDFWNNSDAIPAARKPRMGSIVFRGIDKAESGMGSGTLQVKSDWIDGKGTLLLHETTQYVFGAANNQRTIDRITTLTAVTPVVFNDNKDGTLGLRVTRELEQPATRPEIFSDGSGAATAVPVLNNEGVTGHYLSADGISGDSVWSTRSRWTELTGVMSGEPITVAILDHPSNYNFPTYWHARGYGLFAANPFGAKDFTEGKKTDNFSLKPGESVTLRYRVLILNGPNTPADVEKNYQAWAK
jgi:hypothetical protein